MAGHLPQLLDEVAGAAAPDALQHLGVVDREVLDELLEDHLLALHVVVERGAAHPERVGDVLDGGPSESALGEQLGGALEDRARHPARRNPARERILYWRLLAASRSE